MWFVLIIALIALSAALLYVGRTKLAWTAPGTILLFCLGVAGGFGGTGFQMLCALFVIAAVVLGHRPIRRAIVTPVIMRVMAGFLPRMSATERIALEAGTLRPEDRFDTGEGWIRVRGKTIRDHRAYGVLASARALAGSVGPIVGGSMGRFVGLPWVFVWAGAMTLVGAVLAATLVRETPPSE